MVRVVDTRESLLPAEHMGGLTTSDGNMGAGYAGQGQGQGQGYGQDQSNY